MNEFIDLKNEISNSNNIELEEKNKNGVNNMENKTIFEDQEIMDEINSNNELEIIENNNIDDENEVVNINEKEDIEDKNNNIELDENKKNIEVKEESNNDDLILYEYIIFDMTVSLKELNIPEQDLISLIQSFITDFDKNIINILKLNKKNELDIQILTDFAHKYKGSTASLKIESLNIILTELNNFNENDFNNKERLTYLLKTLKEFLQNLKKEIFDIIEVYNIKIDDNEINSNNKLEITENNNIELDEDEKENIEEIKNNDEIEFKNEEIEKNIERTKEEKKYIDIKEFENIIGNIFKNEILKIENNIKEMNKIIENKFNNIKNYIDQNQIKEEMNITNEEIKEQHFIKFKDNIIKIYKDNFLLMEISNKIEKLTFTPNKNQILDMKVIFYNNNYYTFSNKGEITKENEIYYKILYLYIATYFPFIKLIKE
jgi:hypothetical protein